jgi:S-adenosylmethionine-dependent methyltransferase
VSTNSPFEPAVGRWLSSLGSVRDAVRQELVAGQLAEHLPSGRLRVLDVGCGQGTQAIRLVAAGHEVTGIDLSRDLLDRAHADAVAALGDDAQRLHLQQSDLFEFAGNAASEWDVVCCHGVVMYLPSLAEAVAALVPLVRPGGLLSLLTRNQAGIAMRAGMARHWSDALAAFDSAHYVNNIGITGARADRIDEVRSTLSAAGADTVAWFGVRLFSDPLPVDEQMSQDEFDALLAAEVEAARRDPFRQVAALTHTIAVLRL